MTRFASIVIVLLLAASPYGVQQTPTRDGTTRPGVVGSATIAGVVVSDEVPARPVRRAIVTLTGAGLQPSRGAITDDEGRFTIANLPAGRFTLTASRAAFVTSVYGAKRPGRPGTPVIVADGQQLTGLTMRLWRGAAISGVLRDERGGPAEGIEIVATPAQRPNENSILTLSNNPTRTNELGQFRIFGLAPDTYVVSARPSAPGSTPILAMTEAEVDAALEAIKQRASGAIVPTQQLPPAATQPAIAQKAFDYAPIYFPGVPEIAQAQTFTLTPGQDLTGIEFSLKLVPTAVVTGVIRRGDGQPLIGARVQMTAITSGGPFARTPRELDGSVEADGTFRVHQVTPGVYRVIARAPAQAPAPQDPRVGFVSPTPSDAQLWAATELSVIGTDVTGVTLDLSPGPTMTGRLVFESGSSRQPPDPARISISMFPAEIVLSPAGTSITTIAFLRPAPARADGTFRLDSIAPGNYRFTVGGPVLGTDWMVRSAMVGGIDLMDGEVTVGPGTNLADVVVTISDRRTSLSGRLQTATGAAVSDVFVIAYAADPKHWGPGARRVQGVRPDVDGRYTFAALPPGEYLLAAVIDVDQDEWRDRAFLEQLVAASIKVTLVEGDATIQDVRIGG